ncbi:MAG TPA: hypothetical protein VFB16_07985 [Bauldia sp.]|nr:hypothetical protein [Bauldia sp.]
MNDSASEDRNPARVWFRVMLAPWLFLCTFSAVIVDLGANHGAYTLRLLTAVHDILSTVGIA